MSEHHFNVFAVSESDNNFGVFAVFLIFSIFESSHFGVFAVFNFCFF